MDLTTLTDELTSFHATFQEKAKAALKETFTKFFADFPEVAHLQWTQYTPYFNDGDACVFGVGEIAMYLTKEGRAQFGLEVRDDDKDEDEEDDTDGEGDVYSLYTWAREGGRTYISPRAQSLCETVTTISKGLNGIESFLEAIYGDHVEVTLHRDGTSTVDGYEHD